jgi:hypothetical protein
MGVLLNRAKEVNASLASQYEDQISAIEVMAEMTGYSFTLVGGKHVYISDSQYYIVVSIEGSEIQTWDTSCQQYDFDKYLSWEDGLNIVEKLI